DRYRASTCRGSATSGRLWACPRGRAAPPPRWKTPPDPLRAGSPRPPAGLPPACRDCAGHRSSGGDHRLLGQPCSIDSAAMRAKKALIVTLRSVMKRHVSFRRQMMPSIGSRLRLALLMFFGVYPVITLYIYALFPLTTGWQMWQRTLLLV